VHHIPVNPVNEETSMAEIRVIGSRAANELSIF